MPLIASFEKHGLIESIRELRKRPAGTYGIAIAAVGLAVALRMAVGSQLLPGLSFITFYPAIIIAALVGGFSRGLLATVLSALAAWYLFVPTYEGWGLDYYSAFSLALFCVICLANLGLVYLLDTAIDRALSQEQNVRTLFQSAPNGVLVVDNDGRITLVNASLEQLFGYKQSELLGRGTASYAKRMRLIPRLGPWAGDVISAPAARMAASFPSKSGSIPSRGTARMASSQPSSTSPSACGRRNHSNSSFESCTIGHRTCLR